MAQDDYLYQTVYKDPMQEYPDTDVSALRDVPTARDTTLFHKVSPGLTGISIDPYGSGGNYMTEWGRILTEGLDPIQKAQAPTPVDTPVDTGGGGGGAQIPGAVDTLVNVNTPFEQNLLDQGIGVQASPGDPVGAAFEEQLTQEAIDDLADYPVTPVGGQPIDPTGMLPQISTQPDLGEVTADDYGTPTVIAGTAPLEDAGAGIDDMYRTDYQGEQPQDTSIIMQNIGEGITEDDIESIPITIDAAPKIMDTPGVTTVEPFSELDDLEADPGAQPVEGLTTEQSNTLQNIVGQAGQTVKGAMNQLSKIPGAVADFANQTVDIFGKKFNVGKTLAMGAINKIAGGPISLVFDALGALDLPGGRSEMSDKLGEQYGMDDIGRLTSGPMQGYSVGPNFGQTIQDRIDNINETLNNMTPEQLATTTLKDRVKDLEGMKSVVDYDRDAAIDEGIQTAEDDKDPEDIGFDTVADEEFAETGDYDVYAGGGADQDPVGPDFGDTDYADPGVDTEENQPNGDGSTDTDPAGDFDGWDDTDYDYTEPTGELTGAFDIGAAVEKAQDQGRGGVPPGSTATKGRTGHPSGGDAPGGGKSIVCTAMYQTTGLEDWSKAMKIWYIYQKKYLTIQHQEGYHKLFKPFVKGMHKSNIIKAIGAHVARHRTQDLKHIMFGSKPSWLGRIYRKILEPICYWVGKYAKR